MLRLAASAAGVAAMPLACNALSGVDELVATGGEVDAAPSADAADASPRDAAEGGSPRDTATPPPADAGNAFLTISFGDPASCSALTVVAGTATYIAAEGRTAPGACQICVTTGVRAGLATSFVAPRAGKVRGEAWLRNPTGTPPAMGKFQASLLILGTFYSGGSSNAAAAWTPESTSADAPDSGMMTFQVTLEMAMTGQCALVDDIALAMQ
jgi:hypothetical protein